jgi:hypothetical protein
MHAISFGVTHHERPLGYLRLLLGEKRESVSRAVGLAISPPPLLVTPRHLAVALLHST